MSSEWRCGKLGDFIELKRGYDLPKTKRASGPYPLVSSSGVSDCHSEPMVRGPGVVTGRYGTIGQVYFVDDDFWPLNTTLYVRDFKGNDPRFISYFLTTVDFFVYSDKAAVPGVNRNHLHEALVEIPDLTTQQEIAKSLGALDDRIALLRQTNTTLEAIAQALFKSWFVDFDPVRAKQKGREPEGMDAATAALFPDSFEESELGLVPKGWEVTTIKNLTTKIGSGATPRGGREVYLDEGVALIRSQNVYDSEFVWAGLARISDEAATQLSGVEVKQHDVLLNITGASILRTCVVNPDALPARVNQHVAIIRAKPGISARYIHLHLLQQKTKNYLMALNSGASREAITKSHIEHLPILNPGLALLTCFQEVVAPVYAKAEQTAAQSQTLATLRDTLLPRLISGQLRLPEVEAMLKDSCDADTVFGQ